MAESIRDIAATRRGRGNVVFRALRLCSLALLLLASEALRAEPGYITFPSDVSWMTRRSAHFQILYREGETEFAERALVAAEKAHKLLAPIFPEKPELIYVVLADFKDGLNGYAIDFPYPHMVIFGSPPDGSSTLSVLDDWLESVILHELVHVFHLFPASGLWKAGRSVFGSWVLPNGLMPSHLHEGLAVFLETELGTAGRGQGADFRMYRRMAVHSGKWGNAFAPVDLFEGSVLDWPHGHSPYFFGYWSWKEVYDRKKLGGIRDVVTAQSGNWPYWISRPFKNEIGITYPELLKSSFDKGEKAGREEIARFQKEGLSKETFLTDTRYNKWDLTASPDGKLMALRTSHPDNGTRVEILNAEDLSSYDRFEPDSGTEHGMCLGIRNGKVRMLYTDTRSDSGYQTYILKSRILEDKDTSDVRIKKDDDWIRLEHVHAFSCSPDLSVVAAYVEHAGKGRILKLQALLDKDDIDELRYAILEEWNIPKASWVSALLVDNKTGEKIRGILRDKNGSHLYQWAEAELKSGAQPSARNLGLISRHHFHSLSYDSHDAILAVGGEDGKNDLWEIQTTSSGPQLKRRVSVLGGLSGAAYVKVKDAPRLLGLSYRHGGYDLAAFDSAGSESVSPPKRKPIPVVIERSPAEGADTTITPRAGKAVDATSILLEAEESYSPWDTLAPRAWIPNLLIVPDGMQISAWVPGFDIGQKNSYSLFGGYDTRGSVFFSASYAYRFNKASITQAELFYSPSYLISTRSFLKTWGANVGLSTSLGFIDPRFTFTLQQRKVESGNGVDPKQSIGFGISSSHSFGFRSRPRAIAPHRGTRMSASYARYFTELGSTDPYYTFTASADQYVSSPWAGSHIFYFAARFGHTQGTVLYNSFFQGGGELIFSQGRGFFMNRGFVPGSFLGRRMLSLNAEYRFPLWDVYRGPGLWPGFLQRIHGAFVGDVLTFDFGKTREGAESGPRDLFRVYYASAGFELKSDWRLFYYLPATIRLGFYRGFGSNATFGISGEPLYVTFALEAGLF